jgi:hypothetical protein
MTLIDCRRALLHHIVSGDCANYAVDATTHPRPQRTACRCIAQDFHSAADVSQAVLEIILGADRNQMSTESLLHVAAALNLTISGSRNLRFKIRALLRNILNSIASSETHNHSSASVADFFNSFESHRRPVLVSIAALHRIEVPTNATIEMIRTKITEHITSGLAETVDMTFTHLDSYKKCVLKRTQLPLVPAFAMTAHKAQGKTMEVVVVDLESTRGTESPYVMLSRAKSLDGVFILRPFRQKVIQCRPSEDVRNEFKRLDVLCHQTKMKYGTPAESAMAQEYLVKTFSPAALPEDGEPVDFTPGNTRTLAQLQSSSARLISESTRSSSNQSTCRTTCSSPRRARNRPM